MPPRQRQSVSLDPEVKAQLQQIAGAKLADGKRTSISAIVNAALREYLHLPRKPGE